MSNTHPMFRRIKVEGLWGTNDLDIFLNPGAGAGGSQGAATLVAGANGCGKTTIFRMVRAVFDARFAELLRIKFSRMVVELDSGTLSVRPSSDTAMVSPDDLEEPPRPLAARRPAGRAPVTTQRKQLELLFNTNAGNEQRWLAAITDSEWARAIERPHPDLVGPGPAGEWKNRETGQVYATDEDLIQAHASADGRISARMATGAPDWYSALRRTYQTQLIESGRLQRQTADGEEGDPPWRRVPTREAAQQDAVMACARDAGDRLRSLVQGFAQTAQGLDRNFVSRVLALNTAPGRGSPDYLDLKQQHARVQRRLSQLSEHGLMQFVDPPAPVPEEAPSEEAQRIIALYVADLEKKVGVFDSDAFAKSAPAFLDALNDMLSTLGDKRARLDAKQGILVEAGSGESRRSLPLSALSSGEQHLLVMLYEMSFPRGAPPRLIMIDEPEISLHVQWQLALVGALEAGARAWGAQLLIATHSPAIISGRAFIELSPMPRMRIDGPGGN